MLTIQHTADCVEQNAEYFAANPHACRMCNGTGQWNAAPAAIITRDELVDRDGKKIHILEVGDGGPTIKNTCDGCFGKIGYHGAIMPHCPRCQLVNPKWAANSSK